MLPGRFSRCSLTLVSHLSSRQIKLTSTSVSLRQGIKKKNTQYLFLLRLGCHRKLDKLPKSPGEGEARLCENAASNQQRAGERRSEGGRLPVLQDVPDCRLGPYFSPRLIPLPGQRRGNRASSQAEEDIRDAVRLDLYLVSHYNQQQCLF